MLCKTHVKIKYDNEAKKGDKKERKKEVGALIAGHSRLVTQPVLKVSVKENEVPTEKRV